MAQLGYQLVFLVIFNCAYQISSSSASPEEKRLFENLLTGYNKLIRPVVNDSEVLKVRFRVKLSQLLDVNEKNQIMTTNVWLKHIWYDYKLVWDPEEYGGVASIYVPAELIWLPDIVLYNNADGHYQVTIMTKASIHFNGTVVWEPPAIYKSMCPIDVMWFPFDEQVCELKFGSWTYDGFEVDLLHYDTDRVVAKLENSQKVWEVSTGLDISEFNPSVEWDIMAVPAVRHEGKYPCCPAPYIDITYAIYLRRKTLFYTVNLIVPCVGISFLTILVFYLPSDSGEKVTLCISILISLTVFFLLLVEIIPSTSQAIPLIAKYLLFTMVMVTCSITVTVVTLNAHFRSPDTHNMPDWVRSFMLGFLPKVLLMRRPRSAPKDQSEFDYFRRRSTVALLAKGQSQSAFFEKLKMRSSVTQDTKLSWLPPDLFGSSEELHQRNSLIKSGSSNSCLDDFTLDRQRRAACNDVHPQLQPRAVDMDSVARAAKRSACFIADHFKKKDSDDEIREDWRYIALVLDRLFLWIFTLACLFGTIGIVMVAPVIYDTREPITT